MDEDLGYLRLSTLLTRFIEAHHNPNYKLRDTPEYRARLALAAELDTRLPARIQEPAFWETMPLNRLSSYQAKAAARDAVERAVGYSSERIALRTADPRSVRLASDGEGICMLVCWALERNGMDGSNRAYIKEWMKGVRL